MLDADCSQLAGGVLLMGAQRPMLDAVMIILFYSTLDRIDSGEVPIRAMAEIL